MDQSHKIGLVIIEDDTLRIEIDGKLYKFNINNLSEKLSRATEQEKNDFNVSPSGYGIHWNLIDEDLSVKGLLGTV